MHSPNFIQIPPEFHLCRVRADLDQVPAEEHLAPFDLGALLVEKVFDGFLVRSVVCHEYSRSNIMLEELLIDHVDNSGD